MRSFLFCLLLSIFCFHCQNASPAEQADAADPTPPPNVVLIFTDDQGYQDVGVYGSPDIQTPNLDRLASEGARFTDFYVAQPVCSASRAALMTGCYPNRLGIHGALMPKAPKGLHPDEQTIAELLKPLGYATALYGKWHLGDHPDFLPTKQGFDEYFGIPYSNDMWPLHPQQGPVFDFGPLPLIEGEVAIDTLEDQTLLTTQITERAVDFIQRHKDQPFFLYVPHPMPHVPLFVSDKFAGKSEAGLYGDVIMEIDWSVGEIMNTLQQHDLTDNTLVVFISDNGPWLNYGEHAGRALPLREGKGTTLEGGVRVPCIARLPGTIPAGLEITEPVIAMDWLPTIVSLTGAAMPERKIDGASILPLLKGEEGATSPHEALYFYYRSNELHAIRSGPWKLHFPHTYRSLNGRAGGKGGLPVNYDQNEIGLELYNLREDIAETTDVAEQHPEVVARLMVLAEESRKELGDALTEQEGEGVREHGKR